MHTSDRDNAASACRHSDCSNDRQAAGPAHWLYTPILTPRALVAGVEGAVVVGKLLEMVEKDGDTNIGYNAATNTYEDLVKAGIIDPVKVSLPVMPARHLGPSAAAAGGAFCSL